MYDIRIRRGRNSVRLTPAYGYYVSTIDGLTGISASFETVKAINGYGENIVRKTIPPKSITINGKVLDENTAAKQALLDVVLAGKECELTVYHTPARVVDARPVSYRKAKVFVKQSPIITQEKHSKFTFTLTMPNPYFEAATPETFVINAAADAVQPTIIGDVPPEFEFTYTSGEDTQYGATLYCGTTIVGSGFLYLDYTKLPDGSLPPNSTVTVKRVNGRLMVTRATGFLTEENIIAAAYTNSTLWYLPLGGTNKFWLSASGSFSNASITYTPLYSGVLVDGV